MSHAGIMQESCREMGGDVGGGGGEVGRRRGEGYTEENHGAFPWRESFTLLQHMPDWLA